MAYLLHDAWDYYNKTMENGDRRVQEWPLMQGPGPTITICLSYVYFDKVLGPAIMKNRDPLNMRWLMVAYNFFMVFVSIYIFVRLGFLGWFGKFNYRCQPVDYSDSPDATEMAHLAWWYYISKFVEFTDTIFFVLRKKFGHISTLHVIHHGVMPMSVWWGVKFTPGGHSTFFAFVNSLVHILMYIYYGLAAVGPHMYKYLWWKKYMTGIQMVQFIMIFVHSFQLLFRECDYPKGFMWWIGFHAVLFWFLFWDFYKNAYGKPKKMETTLSNGNKHMANGKANGIVNGLIKENCIHQNGSIQKNGLHKRHEYSSNGVSINGKTHDL
ncbi:very long chain fatty acid elongase AAEL008004-like [Tachypleus tridentatus]|uniref:very long chain fatty acid elongase AAEL008004-like n=1 Tax=Tachypleus tridentatus TaxID=6853 RepID=UPI003FD41B00